MSSFRWAEAGKGYFADLQGEQFTYQVIPKNDKSCLLLL